MKNHASLLLLFLLITNLITAQTGANDILYQKGLKAREDYQYQEGLALFQILLKSDSANVNYLAQTSYFFSRVGQLQPTKNGAMEYYHRAEYLAHKAVAQGPEYPESHYSLALALGRINEHASTKQKIANAKVIRTELDFCLKLNPKHDLAWHILGRWHVELASLNGIERLAVNTLFGGMPQGGTLNDAIKCFTKAIDLNPKYMIHQYELAHTYSLRDGKGDKELAISTLKSALLLPNIAPDDAATRKHCEELLKKLE